MKRLGILLTLLALLPTTHLDAQKVRIRVMDVCLSDILHAFEEQSGINLVYANTLIGSTTVSCSIEAEPVFALSTILKQTAFDFLQQKPDQWVIVPRESTRNLPGEISGVLLDDSDQMPVAGANIFLNKTSHGSETDSTGRFHMPFVSPGNYNLMINRIGYQPKYIALVLRGNETRFLTVKMTADPRKMPGVVIEERPQIRSPENRTLAEQRLSNEQINLAPLQNSGEVLEIIHQQPGVSRRQKQDLIPHLEGGAAFETAIELDGIPFLVPTFSYNRRSFFSTSTISSLTIHRAGYGPARGDAMSGVIEMHTREIEEIPNLISTSVTPKSIDLQAKIVAGKWGWTGSWRGANLGEQDNARRQNASDLFGKMTYQFSESRRLTLLALWGSGSLIQTNNSSHIDDETYNVGIRYDVRGRSRQHSSILLYNTALGEQARESGLKLQQSLSVDGIVRMTYGLQLANTRMQTQVTFDSLGYTKDLRPADQKYDWSSLVLSRNETVLATPYLGIVKGDGLYSWQLGMRFPVEAKRGISRLEPRLQIGITPFEPIELHTAFGRYYQFVNRSYLTEAKSGDDSGFGEYFVDSTNPAPSYADHVRIGLSSKVLRGWRLSVSVYHKDYHFSDRFYLSRINNEAWLLRLKAGVARGAEFWLGKSYGRSQGWISYSTSNTIYYSEGGLTFQPYFHQSDILQIVFKHYLPGPWQLNWHYAQYSGYPNRSWTSTTVKLDPGMGAEDFHEVSFADSYTSGSLKQLTMSLRWYWGKMAKGQSLDLVARFSQELIQDRPYFDSEFWFVFNIGY